MDAGNRRRMIEEAIRSAFADVPYPGDENIAHGPEYHPYDDRSDKDETLERLGGKHWRDLTLDDMLEDRLIGFSRLGQQFYLPAHLLHSFVFTCQAEPRLGTIADHTLYALWMEDEEVDRKADLPLNPWLRYRFSILTRAQRRAIRLYLEYVRDEAEMPDDRQKAAEALLRYWARAEEEMVEEPLPPQWRLRKPRGT